MTFSKTLFTLSAYFVSAIFLFASQAQGQLISISTNTNFLQANTPNQEILLDVGGTRQVRGVNLFAEFDQVMSTNPQIVSVDLVTATIFGAVGNTGQNSLGNSAEGGIGAGIATNSSSTIAADGLLARLVIDTTGISGGDFNLNLNPVSLGNTEFFESSPSDIVPFSFANSTFAVVPEPTSTALVAVMLGSVILRRRRD